MKISQKTLMNELVTVRQRVGELEAECKGMGEMLRESEERYLSLRICGTMDSNEIKSSGQRINAHNLFRVVLAIESHPIAFLTT